MRHLAIMVLFIVPPLACATDDLTPRNCAGKARALVVSLQGMLEYDSESKGQWKEIQLNQTLCEGSRIHVGAFSRASVLLPNGFVARIDEDTVLTFNVLNPDKPAFMDLLKGFVHFISRTPKHLQINTPIANAGPEGTEFALSVNDKSASLWVYEGGVKFFNTQGSINLKPGQGAQAYPGQAPQARIDIRPQDAVNWALYYPPLLPYPDKSTPIDNDIRTAIRDFRQGRTATAISRLNTLPPEKQTLYFYKIRGAMLLTVGRVELVQQDIREILKQNPKDAEALALQSVLALTQNRKEEAYALAKQSIAFNPQSASAYSALSYANQGRFELDKALHAATQATKLAPHDAMVWARKAELELALGLTSDSEDTVQQAEKLDAELERTQTVIGFTHLQQINADEAMQAFDKALTLDSTSPLARLGLGLAKIRNGDLEQGRQDLEIAAILDPNNSLIRSYLGKAYYEEKRNPLAEDQFKLAKERDPKDPTPYFYDALKKQTENRPVEALQDLQKAIDLNDNRAVYRSRQLLDSDRAARGASLGRIYDTLGFQQRSVVEAISSLQIDPTNYSAHRFLSDTYVDQQGRETAQLSELLQAKMLQPININPVQANLSVSQRGLLNFSNIANISFQDFTRLYERDRPQLLISGIGGTNNSFGDEATLSGIYKKLSYSLSQYHFGTDGINKVNQTGIDSKAFKETHNIYDVFIQTALTDHFDIQFEYLNRDTFLRDTNQNIPGALKENVARVGFHWKPDPSQHWLGLYTFKKYINTDFLLDEPIDPEDPISGPFTSSFNHDAHLWEGQFIKLNDFFNLTAGFSYYELTDKETDTILNNGQKFPGVSEYENGFNYYGFSNVQASEKLNLTLGLTYNQHDPDIHSSGHTSKWSPKLGLQWDLSDFAKLRLAYFSGYKKPLLVNQTLEPTHIAGFNQIFDDFNDRAFNFYGAAIDFSWPNVFLGLQFNHRRVFTFDNNSEVFNKSSDIFKTYFNFTINNNYSILSEYTFENNLFFDLPQYQTVNTHKIPLEIRYFNSNGFFSKVKSTWIIQNEYYLDHFNNKSINSDAQFVVLDFDIGYRLPKRLGIISLGIKNILNEKFKYNNLLRLNNPDNFNNNLEFFTQRTILGRVTLNF